MESKGYRLIAVLLAVLVTAALTGTAGWAAPVPSQSSCGGSAAVDQKAVAAERELVKGKLMDFGLTDKDAQGRVDLLTDQEVHALAADLDQVQVAGDDIHWDTTTVLLALILLVLIVD
ncbi:MAG: PA2779 family protein [Armatimonadota bacterium]